MSGVAAGTRSSGMHAGGDSAAPDDSGAALLHARWTSGRMLSVVGAVRMEMRSWESSSIHSPE